MFNMFLKRYPTSLQQILTWVQILSNVSGFIGILCLYITYIMSHRTCYTLFHSRYNGYGNRHALRSLIYISTTYKTLVLITYTQTPPSIVMLAYLLGLGYNLWSKSSSTSILCAAKDSLCIFTGNVA